MKFLEKLESLKQCGVYAIDMYYGEDVGCDDLGVPMLERGIKITFRPVGVIGEARMLWIGNVAGFLECDFSDATPIEVSNPPPREIMHEDGFYVWGTESSLKTLKEMWPLNKGS